MSSTRAECLVDLGALPPEINSACMYLGAGAAPLLGAAAAWNGIAVELSSAASSFESVIMRLSTEQWMGPASLSMAAAAQPLLVWWTYTADSSALAAAQAMASAAAFETAFASTVPPAEVAANRAQLAALMAANILGQNAPAIAATEARYGEMWAQDASAMYGYAASSAVAGRLNPLARPSRIADAAGIANQAAAVGQAAASGSAQQVGLSNLISNVPNAVMSLASPVSSEAEAAGLRAAVPSARHSNLAVEHAWHGVSGAWADFTMVTATTDEGADADIAGTAGRTASGAGAAAALARTIAPAGVGGPSIVAGLGSASSVGRLSVPASWSTAAPVTTVGTALDGTGWVVPEQDEPSAAMPPGPVMVLGANGASGGAGPRYGVKPIVMPKQVFV